MKTEDWVSLLAAGVEPIDAKRTVRRTALAVTGGMLAALALTGGMLRFNPALPREVLEPMFWVRAAYCAALAWLGLAAVIRLAHPGKRFGAGPAGIGAVAALMWVIAALVEFRAPAGDRAHLLFGTTAAVCPFLIALIASPPFIALLWVLRGLAPTRLRSAGGAAGFTAGALGALA